MQQHRWMIVNVCLLAVIGVWSSSVRADIFVASGGSTTNYAQPSVVYRFDNQGNTIGAFAGPDNHLASPRGMTFGPDGNFYVASSDTGEVLRYNGTTGAFMDVFVTAHSGSLLNAEAVVFGNDGYLYVADFGTSPTGQYDGQVLRYDASSGAFVGVFASMADVRGSPYGMLFGPNGNLFVAVIGRNTAAGDVPGVLQFDGTGQFINVFTQGGDLSFPRGVVFGPDGNMYVVDATNNSRVAKFDGTTGQYLGDFVPDDKGLMGSRMGAFGPDGLMYICSFSGASFDYDYVQQWDGQFLNLFIDGNNDNTIAGPPWLIFGPNAGGAVVPRQPAPIANGSPIQRTGTETVDLQLEK